MRAFEYDHDKCKWTCQLSGPGEPVIEADTPEELTAFLRKVDLRIEAAAADARRINLKFRSNGNAGIKAGR